MITARRSAALIAVESSRPNVNRAPRQVCPSYTNRTVLLRKRRIAWLSSSRTTESPPRSSSYVVTNLLKPATSLCLALLSTNPIERELVVYTRGQTNEFRGLGATATVLPPDPALSALSAAATAASWTGSRRTDRRRLSAIFRVPIKGYTGLAYKIFHDTGSLHIPFLLAGNDLSFNVVRSTVCVWLRPTFQMRHHQARMTQDRDLLGFCARDLIVHLQPADNLDDQLHYGRRRTSSSGEYTYPNSWGCRAKKHAMIMATIVVFPYRRGVTHKISHRHSFRSNAFINRCRHISKYSW